MKPFGLNPREIMSSEFNSRYLVPNTFFGGIRYQNVGSRGTFTSIWEICAIAFTGLSHHLPDGKGSEKGKGRGSEVGKENGTGFWKRRIHSIIHTYDAFCKTQ